MAERDVGVPEERKSISFVSHTIIIISGLIDPQSFALDYSCWPIQVNVHDLYNINFLSDCQFGKVN